VWSRPVVAVGGSNGKTTTKELVRSALGATLNVHATAANLNNRIGVPQTLLALPESADVAVIEVGTSQPGEIAILRDIVKADIALITTVQEEHLEGFGDLAGVMAEEMALCNDVALAIVPASEPAVVAEARKRARTVVAAGLKMGEVRAESFGLDQNGTGWMRVGDVTVRVPAPGMHNVRNAILAMAVARACGVTDADAARGIASAMFPPMRSSVAPMGDAILVNDAYNANPGSMRAALALLESVGAGRSTVAILGTMRELGPRSDAFHDDVARVAIAGPFDVIAVVGDFVRAFQRVAPNDARVIGAADPDELWPALAPRLDRRSAVLLKGSRGVRMERLVPKLEAWAGVAQSGGQ
jgi:UDP-N-acetylmuramoyl-tripeptide--D-alanyl-D-alanine ligase